MHLYRHHYKKKKKVNVFVPGIMIGLVALFLFFQEQDGLLMKLKREICQTGYEKMMTWCVPDLVYHTEELERTTIAERLAAHFSLLEKAENMGTDYPTQVESALSCEMILAMEAADENYVDEKTGEPVLTEETAKELAGAENVTGVNETEAAGNEAAAADDFKTDGGIAGANETETAGNETGDAEAVPAGTSGTGTSADAAKMPMGALEKAVVYPREKLNDFDFLIQNFYQVDNTTTIDGNQLNAQELLARDMRLVQDASAPQILIYHTHSQEGYVDSVPGDLATSVVGVGDYLTNLLTEQYGLNVIHHRGTYDVDDRDHAYSKAGPALEQILAENPSIEVVIDLHRDGVREDTHLVANVNGKETAQIMFFNGLSRTTKMGDIDYLYNPYIQDNLAMSLQMQLAAAEYYPGFTRRVYLKGYRYNMHYCPKTLLVEVGAQTNTFGEALNAMEPLADILNKVLTGTQ